MIKWNDFLPFIHECVCEKDIFNCSWFLLIGLGAIFEYRFDIAIIVNGWKFGFLFTYPVRARSYSLSHLEILMLVLNWILYILFFLFIFLSFHLPTMSHSIYYLLTWICNCSCTIMVVFFFVVIVQCVGSIKFLYNIQTILIYVHSDNATQRNF